jgi:hypothetical protein
VSSGVDIERGVDRVVIQVICKEDPAAVAGRCIDLLKDISRQIMPKAAVGGRGTEIFAQRKRLERFV